jgi:uncharacterized protein (UPF0333 family)
MSTQTKKQRISLGYAFQLAVILVIISIAQAFAVQMYNSSSQNFLLIIFSMFLAIFVITMVLWLLLNLPVTGKIALKMFGQSAS